MTPKEIQQFEQDEIDRRSEWRDNFDNLIKALPFKVYTSDSEISDGEKIPKGVYILNYDMEEWGYSYFVIAADSKEELIKFLKKAFRGTDSSWEDFLIKHNL